MLPNVLKRKHMNYPSVWDEFFTNDFLSGFWDDNWSFSSNVNTPAVNVEETNTGYTIEVAAPGLDKNDFKVQVDNNVLTVFSKKESKNEEKRKGYLRKEFSYGTFQRSFTLPEGTESEKITASHKNGVLKLEIPKAVSISNNKEIKIS